MIPRTRGRSLVLGTLLILIGLAGCTRQVAPDVPDAALQTKVAAAEPAPHIVHIHGMVFDPADLTVAPGDTVTWTNDDLVAHSATALDSTFDSKIIAPGASWSFVPKQRGALPYKCVFHPTMKGSFTVK